jgi:hypothetical protein
MLSQAVLVAGEMIKVAPLTRKNICSFLHPPSFPSRSAERQLFFFGPSFLPFGNPPLRTCAAAGEAIDHHGTVTLGSRIWESARFVAGVDLGRARVRKTCRLARVAPTTLP